MRLYICLLGLLMAAVGADEVVSVYEPSYKAWSQVSVHGGHSSTLHPEEGYFHRTATFGLPPYGSSLVHPLYYANSVLCDPDVDHTIGFPKRDIDNITGEGSWPTSFYLVDRGGCSFVTKARNAQNVGAPGLLIADTSCRCGDTSCTPSYEGQRCESGWVILGDGGTGSDDIVIPTVMLFKGDADVMKQKLRNNSHIRLELNFAVDPLGRGDRVEYELWDKPRDPLSQQFHQDMRDIAVALGASASFTPYQMIFDGILSNCQGAGGEDLCYNLCTNHGRYCAADPEGELDRGISGADIVTESLRRMCIWELYGTSEKHGVGTPWYWFDYVNYFEFFCSSDAFFTSQACVGYAYEHANIDGSLIAQCMEEDSGGLEGNVVNTLLEQALVDRRVRGTALIPSVFVNNAAVPGQVSALNVFTAVCAGFAPDMAPAFCHDCLNLDDLEDICFEDTISCAAARGYCASDSSTESNRFKSSSDLGRGASFVAMAVAIAFNLVFIFSF